MKILKLIGIGYDPDTHTYYQYSLDENGAQIKVPVNVKYYSITMGFYLDITTKQLEMPYNTEQSDSITAYDSAGKKIEDIKYTVKRDTKNGYFTVMPKKEGKVWWEQSRIHGALGTTAELQIYDYKQEKIIDIPTDFKFISSNEEIFKVDSKGKLTFVSLGEATLSISNSIGNVGSTGNVNILVMPVKEWEEAFNWVDGKDLDEIKSKINSSEIVSVSVNEEQKIDSSVFKALGAKENKDTILNIESGAIFGEGLINTVWSFVGSDIANSDIDLNTEMTISDEPAEKIEDENIKDGLFIDFSHSGKLPGKAIIKIYIGTEKYGEEDKTLFLYYYNEETKKYEARGEAEYSNGVLTIEIDHCSTWVVSEEELKVDETANPKTGDLAIILFTILGALGVAGLIYSTKKYSR